MSAESEGASIAGLFLLQALLRRLIAKRALNSQDGSEIIDAALLLAEQFGAAYPEDAAGAAARQFLGTIQLPSSQGRNPFPPKARK